MKPPSSRGHASERPKTPAAPSHVLRLEAARAALQPKAAAPPRQVGPPAGRQAPPAVRFPPAPAVQRSVSAHPPAPVRAPVRVIQCTFGKVSVARVDSGGAHVLAIRQFIESVKDAVDKAYQHVLSTPTLGVLANLDGHTRHWVEKWKRFVETGHGELMAAAFGYAIESVATHVASPFKPTAPPGMSFMLQGERSGTRPDVILMSSGMEVAWVDITASSSTEHIFTQKVGWTDRMNVAEITYPSTEMSTIRGTAGTMPGVQIDSAEIFRNIGFQQYYLEQLRSIFVEQGRQLFGGLRRPSGDAVLRDQLRREWVLRILRESGPLRGLEIDERTAANILYAMGLSPETYGFPSSTSRSTGEHLLRTFQHVPMLTAPAQTVPRSLSSPFGGGFDLGALFRGSPQSSSSSSTMSIGSRIGLAHSPSRSLALRNRSPLERGSRGIMGIGKRLRGTLAQLGTREFKIQSLPALLTSIGIPLESIRSCRMVINGQNQEPVYLFYSRQRGIQIRRMPSSLALQGGGSRAMLTGPSSSALALTSPRALGEVVPLNPSQSYRLLAYSVETEEDEVISGINQSLM